MTNEMNRLTDTLDRQVTKQHMDFALAQKLSAKFGPITSTSGKMQRLDGGPLPDEAVDQAKIEVAKDRRWYEIKKECMRRIFTVTKDLATQFNIIAWLISASGTNETDVRLARDLIRWMAETRTAARDMKSSDRNYMDDRFWPRPPPGVQALVEKF